MAPHGTFNIIIGKTSFTFSIIGYDRKYRQLRDVIKDIEMIISTMKERGDFTYECESDCAEMLVKEAWGHHICLDYEYPDETFFTS